MTHLGDWEFKFIEACDCWCARWIGPKTGPDQWRSAAELRARPATPTEVLIKLTKLASESKTDYRYDNWAAFDAGEKRHPQVVIRERFPDASHFVPQSLGDCWWFRATAKEELPVFVEPFAWSKFTDDPVVVEALSKGE